VVAMSCDATARSLGRVRLQVDLLRSSLGSDLTDDVLLITSELASNAVQHADTVFTFRLQLASGGVLVLIEDGSLKLPIAPSENDPLSGRGRGLLLVSRLSSQYGYSTSIRLGKKLVWALIPWTSAQDLN